MLPEVKNLFRPLTLFIAVLHAVYMLAGCGADDDIEEEVPPVKFVSVDPPSGSSIAGDAIITATFDGVFADVIVSQRCCCSYGQNTHNLGSLHTRQVHSDNHLVRWNSTAHLHCS